MGRIGLSEQELMNTFGRALKERLESPDRGSSDNAIGTTIADVAFSLLITLEKNNERVAEQLRRAGVEIE